MLLGLISAWLGIGLIVFMKDLSADAALINVLKLPFNWKWGLTTQAWWLQSGVGLI